jgi:hypothetical protein
MPPLIGTAKSDRFPAEDVRIRRSLAHSPYVPFIGATQAVDLGSFSLTTTGVLTASRVVSTVAAGTAPLTVTSPTVVGNLNADMVDGVHASSFVPYLGATGDVDIGGHRMSCKELGIASQNALPVAVVLGDLIRLATDGHLYLGV